MVLLIIIYCHKGYLYQECMCITYYVLKCLLVQTNGLYYVLQPLLRNIMYHYYSLLLLYCGYARSFISPKLLSNCAICSCYLFLIELANRPCAVDLNWIKIIICIPLACLFISSDTLSWSIFGILKIVQVATFVL